MAQVQKPVPGELRNADIKAISLVDKGANGRQFAIYKAADWPPEEGRPQVPDEKNVAAAAPAAAGQTEPVSKGVVAQIVEAIQKAFGLGQPPVQVQKADAKGKPTDFAAAVTAIEAEDALWRAFSVARDVVVNILSSAEITDKQAAITKVTEDLKAYLIAKIQTIGVQKALEQIQKAASSPEVAVEKVGKKISAARLQSLEQAYKLLGAVIEEAKAGTEGGEAEVQKEDIEKVVREVGGQVEGVIAKALEPLQARVAELEKAVAGLPKIADEVTKAVEPLAKRVETIEKARADSHAAEPGAAVAKSGVFHGAIFGRGSR